jgi:hypothetical protein
MSTLLCSIKCVAYWHTGSRWQPACVLRYPSLSTQAGCLRDTVYKDPLHLHSYIKSIAYILTVWLFYIMSTVCKSCRFSFMQYCFDWFPDDDPLWIETCSLCAIITRISKTILCILWAWVLRISTFKHSLQLHIPVSWDVAPPYRCWYQVEACTFSCKRCYTITVRQSTRRHIPQDMNLQQHRCEDLKISHSLVNRRSRLVTPNHVGFTCVLPGAWTPLSLWCDLYTDC